MRRWAAGAAALLAAHARMYGGPTGGEVLAGKGSIATDGNLTTVATGDNAIIRWSGFDVGRMETVRFVQPGETSRVLNVIGSVSASRIDGTLLANGQVYLMNTAGITFGSSAVVDVGGLYAVGGSLSSEDFLAGLNRFTGVRGDVTNEGALRGEIISLVGRTVANSGSIVAPGGFVGLVAGEQVYLRGEGSRILVDVGRTAERPVVETGVANGGRIEVGDGRAVLAAGDLYAVAISHDGSLLGSDLRLEGQGGGDVRLTGTVDASAADGAGGEIRVTGERVALLAGASVDASGGTGGGVVRIGGDFLGGNPDVRNSRTTLVAPGASIRADATLEGDGGRIIVWSDGGTHFGGQLSARGAGTGGDGGFAEISGKRSLVMTGLADLTAAGGTRGRLLLDPENITIQAGSPDLDGDGKGNDDIAAVTDLDSAKGDFPGVTSVITAGKVASLLGTADLTLAATKDIRVQSAVSWDSAFGLTLDADGSITISASLTNSGNGAILLDAGAGLVTLGSPVRSGGSVTLTGGTLTLNASATSTGGDLNLTAGTHMTVNSTLQAKDNLDLSFGQSAAGELTVSASLSADGAVTVKGGKGADRVLLTTTSLDGATFSLDGGDDRVEFGDSGNQELTVTGAQAFALGTVSFSSVYEVVTGGGTDSITLPNSNSTIEFKGPGEVKVLDITFSGIESVAAGGGTSDTLVLTAGNDILTVTDDGAATAGGIAFTAIEAVNAKDGGDTAVNSTGSTLSAGDLKLGKITLSGFEIFSTPSLSLTDNDDKFTVTGDGKGTFGGITFTGLSSVDAGGGNDSVALPADQADTFRVTGTGAGSARGISFTKIEAIDGGGGTGNDTLENDTGDPLVVGQTFPGKLTASGFETISTKVLHLTEGDDTFEVVGSGSGTVASVTYTGLETVDAKGGKDTVTLATGINTVSVANDGAFEASAIDFSNVEELVGAGGDDTLELTSGKDTVVLSSSGDFTAAKIDVKGITKVKTGGGEDTLEFTDTAAQSISVDESGKVMVYGVTLEQLEIVAAGAQGVGGEDTVTLTTGDDTFTVTGPGAGKVSALNLEFTGIEKVDGAEGKNTLKNNNKTKGFPAGSTSFEGITFVNFGSIETEILTLTDGADDFYVADSQKGKFGSTTYTGLKEVQGLAQGLAGTDRVFLTGNQDDATVTDLGGVAVKDITFVGFEEFRGNGGSDTLTLTKWSDYLLLKGNGDLQTSGLIFTGFGLVKGGDDSDTLSLEVQSPLTVTGDKAFTLANLKFQDFETANATEVTLTGGNDTVEVKGDNSVVASKVAFPSATTIKGGAGDDLVILTGGVEEAELKGEKAFFTRKINFTEFEEANLGTGSTTVRLTSGKDAAVVPGPSSLTVRGVTFSKVDVVVGQGGEDEVTLPGSDNPVTVNGAGAFTAAGMSFSQFKSLKGGSKTDIAQLSTGADAITLTGPGAFTLPGQNLDFTFFEIIEAGLGADTLTLATGVGATTLLSPETVRVAGVEMRGIDTVSGATGANGLVLTGGDDAVTFGTGGSLTAGRVRFQQFTTVNGGGGNDSLTLTEANEQIAFSFAETFTVAPIGFSDFEEINAGGGADSVTLTSGVEPVTVTGPGAASVLGVALSGIEAVAGNGGGDTVVLGDGSDAVTVTAANAFSTAGIGFTGFFGVAAGGGADTISLSVGDDAIQGLDGGRISAAGIVFSAVETVNALSGAGKLSLTGADESIAVAGTRSVDALAIRFNGLDRLAGGAGRDSVLLTGGNEIVILNGPQAFTTEGIAFSEIEALNAAGGEDRLTLTPADETVALGIGGAIAISGVEFSDFEALRGGGGVDTVQLGGAADKVEVSSDKAFRTGGVAFEAFSRVKGGEGEDTVVLTEAAETLILGGPGLLTAREILFSEIEVVDARGGMDQVDLTPGADTVTMPAPGVVQSAGIRFSAVERVRGAGGADQVQLGDAADVVRVTGLAAFETGGIQFSEIPSVSGGAGSDRAEFGAGDDEIVLLGAATVRASGVTLSDFETIEAGPGTDRLTLTPGDETVVVAGIGIVDVGAMRFLGLERFLGGGGSDAVRFGAGADDVRVTGDRRFVSSGFEFTDFSRLFGGEGVDVVTLTAEDETIVIDAAGEASVRGLRLLEIEQIVAGGGFDRVRLTDADDAVALTGAGAVRVLGFALSEVERVEGGGGRNGLTLTAGDDRLEVTGTAAVAAGGVAFDAFQTVSGFGGRDTVLFGAGADTVRLARGGAFASGEIQFSEFEEVDAGAGRDLLRLTDDDEELRVEAAGDLRVAGLALRGFETVEGGGGLDTVRLGSGDDLLEIVAGGVATGGITFGSFEHFATGGGRDRLQLTAGNDALGVIGSGAVVLDGVRFSEIEAVAGGGGEDALRLTPGDDLIEVTAERAFRTAGIAFEAFASVDGGSGEDAIHLPGGDDLVRLMADGSLLTLGLAVRAVESIDGGGGQNALVLTGFDDVVDLPGVREAAVGDLRFRRFDRIDAEGGRDTVRLTSADDRISIAGQERVEASGILVTGVEALDAGAGTNQLDLTLSDDRMIAGDSRALSTFGIAFSGIDVVDARAGEDRLVLGGASDLIRVLGEREAAHLSTIYRGLEEIDAGGGENTVLLTPGDDRVRLTGGSSLVTSGITLSGIAAVDGAAGNDTVVLQPKADIVNLVGEREVTVDGLSLRGFEHLDGGGGEDELVGRRDADGWFISGVNQGSVGGLGFERFPILRAGGGATDTFTFAHSSADITGKILGEGAPVRLENTSESVVTLSGPLVATGVRFGATGAGGFRLTHPANEVATIAGAMGGTLVFRNSAGFAIGTVDGLAGMRVGGNLRLETPTGDLTIDGGVTVGRSGTLIAPRIVQRAVIRAGAEDSSGTLDVEATAGALTMAADAIGRTAGGALRYRAAGPLITGLLDAGTGELSASAGAGLSSSTGAGVNFRAGRARLDAGTGSVGGADAPVRIEVGTLAFRTGADAALDAAANLTLAPVPAMAVNRVGLDGTPLTTVDAPFVTPPVPGKVQVRAQGALVTTGLEAGGSLLLESVAGDVQVEGDIKAGGAVSLVAGRALRQAGRIEAGATLDLEAGGGDLRQENGSRAIAGGNARLAASGDLRVSSVQAAAVSLVAGGDLVGLGEASRPAVDAGEVRLDSGGAVGTVAEPFALASGRVGGRAAEGLTLVAGAGVEIGEVSSVAVERLRFGQTSIPLLDAGLAGLVAGGDIRVTAGETEGGLRIAAPIVAGRDLRLTTTGGLNAGSALTAGRHLTLESSATVVIEGALEAGSREAGGGVRVAAGGPVRMQAGAAITTRGGNVGIDSGGDLALATVSAPGGQVGLSAKGNIAGVSGEPGRVTANSLRLSASGSIGVEGAALETAIERLDAGASGSIRVRNAGALALGGAGPMTVPAVTAAGVADLKLQDGVGGVVSAGVGADRRVEIVTRSGEVTVAPGAVVGTLGGEPAALASDVRLGTGTHLLPGSAVQGSVELIATAVAGDVRAAGTVRLSGVRIGAEGEARGRVVAAAGTQVVLDGAAKEGFGPDTLVAAPVSGVTRIEADRNVRIAAPVSGANLALVADRDGVAGGGVRVESAGSVIASGGVGIEGSGWAVGGVAGPILEVDRGGVIRAGGDVRVAPGAGAPATAGIVVRAAEGVTGSVIQSGGGTIDLRVGASGEIRLEGTSTGATLLSGAAGVDVRGASTIVSGVGVVGGPGAPVDFRGTVDGGGDLQVTASDRVRFAAAVGGGEALGSLSVKGDGRTLLETDVVRTRGLQEYSGGVTLTQNTRVEAADATFRGTVSGVRDGEQSLHLAVSGQTTFEAGAGAPGGRLATLSTDGLGVTRIVGGTLETVGPQDHRDDLRVGGSVVLSGAAIAFRGTIDSLAGAAGSLEIRSGGAVVIESQVGAATPLAALTSDRGGTLRLLADIRAASFRADDPVTLGGVGSRTVNTTGGQAFGQGVSLDVDARLASASGDIAIEGGVVGPGRTLTVEARAGRVAVAGDIGPADGRLQTVRLAGRDVAVDNVRAVGDIALEIGRDAGTPATANAALSIRGTTVDSENGAVILGAGAWTPGETSDDRTEAPLRSSIFKPNAGDLILAGKTVTIQPYERLAVRDGNLIVFGDEAVTLSSTAASRAVALIAPRIELRTRPSEAVLAGDALIEDRGADLVGGRVLFFRSGAIDTPSRADLAGLDLGKSQGTLLTNTPEVISLLPAPGLSAPSIFLVADLAEERAVLRPLVPQLVYLDLKTAPGLGDVQVLPPERFGGPAETPLRAVPAAGLARASLEQVYVPVMPREERAMEPAEANLAPAMREQLQALGIYARAVERAEEEARGRRAGTFVVVPARARPFESDYEVVDARVEGTSVREVLRLAAECGLVGEGAGQLDRVADALAETYEVFFSETGSEDGLRFRRWVEGRRDEPAARVRTFLDALRTALAEIERLGLTRHELAVSKAQIYGSLLRPRLNADADFLRLAVEGDLDDATPILPTDSP